MPESSGMAKTAPPVMWDRCPQWDRAEITGMIDANAEHLLTIPEAADHIGKITRQHTVPHYSSIFRWVTRGLNGTRLESIKIGGKRYTSREALARFFAESNASKPESSANPSTTPRTLTQEQRDRNIARARERVGYATSRQPAGAA